MVFRRHSKICLFPVDRPSDFFCQAHPAAFDFSFFFAHKESNESLEERTADIVIDLEFIKGQQSPLRYVGKRLGT